MKNLCFEILGMDSGGSTLQNGERIGWEYHNVTLARVPGYGFGIAVSGGRDNPHFMHGDPSIAISDVLKAGPAESKLQVNDRVVTANGISLENVEYSTAVQVLRECGNSVNLLIKRRVFLPPPSDVVKVSLSKNKKKDDFGIVLGCRLYIKEITNRNVIEKDSSLLEGDVVLKVNNTSVENMSLKEVKRIIDASKEKLNLVIKRENINNNRLAYNQLIYENGLSNTVKEPTVPFSDNPVNGRNIWSNQNVYVQPPTRAGTSVPAPPPPPPTVPVEEINAKIATPTRTGSINVRSSRGPIQTEISLTQLDQPATPVLSVHGVQRDQVDGEIPARPPLPRVSNYADDEPVKTPSRGIRHSKSHLVPSLEVRVISFQKDGSVGIRLTGGNEVGIFVATVQPGSPAAIQGLQPGDRLLKVNTTEIRDMTREDAVLLLMSAQDRVDLVVQYRKEEYDTIIAKQKGDSFYIKTHFDYTSTTKGELSFHANEVFHVTDTLFNGTVGSWQVWRLGRNNQEVQNGTIPNRSRAEQMAADQSAEKSKKAEGAENRGSFFKRRSARRSKSFSRERSESLSRDKELTVTKFPAYETVSSKHPGFIRPVVFFGPLSDIARDKLLKEFPDKYSCPQTETTEDDMESSPGKKAPGIFRLSAIREVIEKGKHCLMDVTPSAVDRLNYAGFYPIVIFMRAENKTIVKELRNRHLKANQRPKSSRKLFEQNVKLEKHWPHIFTATIALTGADMWYKKLRETIEKQQQQSIWLPDSKREEVISDDFLFPTFLNASRLSYASSPESDMEMDRNFDCKDDGCATPRLVKASSDPSLAAPDENSFATSHRQLPLHIILRKELSKALRRSDSKKESQKPTAEPIPTQSKDLADQEEYGITTNRYNVEETYANTTQASKQSKGSSPSKTGPEPPPRIDRMKKPSRFRSAHERLFGRSAKEEALKEDLDDGPDYINTLEVPMSSKSLTDIVNDTRRGPSPRPPPKPALLVPMGLSSPACFPGTAASVVDYKGWNGKTGLAYIDNSSFSSDSYSKYGSPHSTLDPKAKTTNGSRQAHDPYRFTKITGQPGTPTKSVPSLERKPSSAYSSPAKTFPVDAIISSPLKPINYQSVYVTGPAHAKSSDSSQLNVNRLSDGRPVPPPKPSNYSRHSRKNSGDKHESDYSQTPKTPPSLSALYGPPSKRASSSAPKDLTGGPPGYYQTTKDLQPPRAPKVPPPSIQELAFSTHSTFTSRRALYSDTDSGYLTGKSSTYDGRSQFPMKTPPGNTNVSNGPYLNVPFPPRSRNSSTGHNNFSNGDLNQPLYSSGGRGMTNGSTSTFHPPPPPPSALIDLSMNRQGSAFEVYKKPEELLSSRPSFNFNGLPPPPPPPPPPSMPPPLSLAESKRMSTVSNDSSHNVVAVAKGKFSAKGGILKSHETGVSIVIPEGALPDDEEQEIYFKVCQDTSMLPPLDQDKGETLLSPIVMCGPRGLTFKAPVELRLPHSASNNPDNWTFALKSSDTSEGGNASDWQNVTPGNDGISASKIDPDFVSVLVDHF